MTLRINRNVKPTYTCKDIIEDKYQELLKRAEEQRDHLAELQNRVMEFLPKTEIVMPFTPRYFSSVETLSGIQAKITLYALYNFADKAYLQIKDLCEVLAKSINGANKVKEEDAVANLEELLNKLKAIFDKFGSAMLENIGIVGLLRVQHISDYMGAKYDFKAVGNWSFRDIAYSVISQNTFSCGHSLQCHRRAYPNDYNYRRGCRRRNIDSNLLKQKR